MAGTRQGFRATVAAVVVAAVTAGCGRSGGQESTSAKGEERTATSAAGAFTRLAHLEGGMRAWEAAGHELLHNPAHASPDVAPHPM